MTTDSIILYINKQFALYIRDWENSCFFEKRRPLRNLLQWLYFAATVTATLLLPCWERKFEIFRGPKLFWFWTYLFKFNRTNRWKHQCVLKILSQISQFSFWGKIFALMELLSFKLFTSILDRFIGFYVAKTSNFRRLVNP